MRDHIGLSVDAAVLRTSGERVVHPATVGRVASLLLGFMLVAVLGSPQGAQAQTYSMRMEPVDYEVMPAGGFPGGDPAVELHSSSWNGSGAPVVVQLPFTFNFFGVPYTEMGVNSAGLVTFGSNHPTLGTGFARIWTIDDPAAPDNMIAMWGWNLVCAGTMTGSNPTGRVQTQVLGSAPNRKFVLDYPNCRGFNLSSSTAFKFQLWLTEGSDDIEVRYGPDPGPGVDPGNSSHVRAMLGVRNADGTDTTPGHCEDVCYSADFPVGMAIIYSAGAQVRVSDLEGPDEGFAGIAFPITYELENPGSEPADGFTVRYWVSQEPELNGHAIPAGYDNRTWSLAPKQTVAVSAEPRVPIELEAGEFYLIVEADPHHVVDISSRGNTIGVHGPFSLGIRAANLAVGWVEAPEIVKPGDIVELSWLAENTGNLPTSDIPYRVTLGPTPSVSPTSLSLGRGRIDSLGMQEQRVEQTQVMVPADIEAGLYYFGVQMDPERQIFEHERRDNVGASNVVAVSTDDLVIVTKSLPQAHFQGAYDYRLIAVGGQGNPGWAVKDDSTLPPGLSLVAETAANGRIGTFLRGVPAKKGDFSFTLQVRSDPVEAEHTFDLAVGSGAYNLTVVTENLAEAAFGFEYEDHLAGAGGIPPYTWELAGGTELPQGVFLRADGFLSGRPQEGGDFPVTFRLTDSQGLQTTKDLTLVVAQPNALTCVTKELPVLQLGEFVRIPLIAAGGPVSTHSWSTVSTVRLVSNIGESSTTLLDPPPGLRLDQGTVVGEPASVGTYLWTLKVTAGTASTECPVLIHVPSDHGLTVTTSGLPLAIAGRSYRAALDVAGGEGPYTWEFIDEQLAETLNMDFEAGNLVGNPPLDALGGEKERAYSFTVRVEDAKGRIGIGALTLQLVEKGLRTGAPEAEDDGGGCQTGSGDASLWGLALLGLALLRRRAS